MEISSNLGAFSKNESVAKGLSDLDQAVQSTLLVDNSHTRGFAHGDRSLFRLHSLDCIFLFLGIASPRGHVGKLAP